MKEIFENLWNEYLWDKCTTIDSDEERELIKRSAQLHEKVNALLDDDEEKAVNKYIDSIYDIESLFIKKAFFKDCEFATAFTNGIYNF